MSMGTNFERSPQGEGNPFRAGYSAFLSSVFDQATAAANSDAAAATPIDSSDNTDASTTDVPLSQSYTETLSLGSESSVNTYSVTKSGSSLPPSTFATATSSSRTQSPNSNTASATAHAESNNSASVSHAHDSDDGLSHGELAAAIVVPIIISLALIALAIMCLRRRSRTQRERTSSDASRGTRTSFFGAGWKEKWGSIRSSASSQHKEPVVTSHSNNAYMTGLDTSSRSNSSQHQHPSSGEYYAPPPPYINAPPELPPLATHNTNISLPTSRRPSSAGVGHELSDLPSPTSHLDHPSPTTPHHFDLPTPAFLDSSARSINSDVYSETASVHSARAARMSIGGPIVETLHTSRSRANMNTAKRNSDPFDDPNTPVSGVTPTGSAMGQYTYTIDEDGRRGESR